MTNFDLAPPEKVVDGLNAVPIDISTITGSLIFDALLQTANADVTINFELGSVGGCPFFDLRQNISEAWLDGSTVLPSDIAHHNFGGGADADLRILEQMLTANSTHTLRLKYTLGTPLSPLPSGRYLPQIIWSSGLRLVFNFGFTDLFPGRYLETWLPANLIFDQFKLDIDIQIANTAISHSLITNGTVTSLSTNHWSVSFPDYFTAFSPLLELRATDSLSSLTDTVMLPVSGKTITVDIWKLATSIADLATVMANVKLFLQTYENSFGVYLHGQRFVVFIISGGMEYDGGTTTSTGALIHETFHSWFGRGVKPASQNDGWWDEAWTEYNMAGAVGTAPFNFSDAIIQLNTLNPFSRITAGGAYDDGERVFEGLASLIGISSLKNIMTEFYQNYNSKPATTQQLEELLICRSGNTAIVDAFYRFVYGFDNPVATPDLWLKDDPSHSGSEYWSGAFWDSPDLWVRNEDDDDLTHQSPEYGQDNWFYARVHNRSATATAAHFIVAFNVKTYAGMEFQYPNDMLPCIAVASGFNLGPGDTTIVKAKWPKALVPPVGTHACLMASVHTRFDHPIAGKYVWEQNNIAQKNLTIVNLVPGDWIIIPFVISNFELRFRRKFYLEIFQDLKTRNIPFSLIHSNGLVVTSPLIANTGKLQSITDSSEHELLECGGQVTPEKVYNSDNFGYWTSNNFSHISKLFNDYNVSDFKAKQSTKMLIINKENEQKVMGIKIEIPSDSIPGETLKLNIVKKRKLLFFRREGRALGGIAVQIRVVKSVNYKT